MPHRELRHLCCSESFPEQNPEFTPNPRKCMCIRFRIGASSQDTDQDRYVKIHFPTTKRHSSNNIKFSFTDKKDESSAIRNKQSQGDLHISSRGSADFWSREKWRQILLQGESLRPPCCWFFRKWCNQQLGRDESYSLIVQDSNLEDRGEAMPWS